MIPSSYYQFISIDVVKFLKHCRNKNYKLNRCRNIVERMYDAYFNDPCCLCRKTVERPSANIAPYISWTNLRSFLVLILLDPYKSYKNKDKYQCIKTFIFCNEACLNSFLLMDPMNDMQNTFSYLYHYQWDNGLLDKFISDKLK
jgi:hypothetical protein